MLGILYIVLSNRLANLCSLCSGVSSALALARHSQSSSLHLANLCALCSGISLALALDPYSLVFFLLDPSFEQNVITSHQFTTNHKGIWLAHAHDALRTRIHRSLVPIPRLSCGGGGKRAWYTLFAHAPSSLGNLHTTPLH